MLFRSALFIGEFPAAATAVLRGAKRTSRAVSPGEACRAQDEQLAGLLDDVHGRVHRMPASGLLTANPVLELDGHDGAKASVQPVSCCTYTCLFQALFLRTSISMRSIVLNRFLSAARESTRSNRRQGNAPKNYATC